MSVFGGDDEKYRKKISLILKLSQKEALNLNLEIKELKGKISPPELDFSIEKVNQSIDMLNKNMGGIFFDKIESSFNEFKSIELKTKINKEIFNIEQNIVTTEKSKTEVLNSIEKIPNLLNLKNSIISKENILNNLKINKEKILELERIKDNVNKLEIDIKLLGSELQDFYFIQNKINDLSLCISNLELYNNKVLESKDKIRIISAENINANNELKDLIELINIENSKLSDLKTQLGKVDFQFSLIESNERILINNQRKIIDLKNRNYNNQVSLNLFQDQLNKYLNIDIGETVLLNEFSLLLKPQSDFLINFNNSFANRSNLINDIAILENEVEIISIREDEISDLVLKVSAIVNDSKLDTCPICKTKHETFDQLINKIIDNSSSNARLNLLRKNIIEKNNELNDIDKFINEGVVYLNGLKNNLLSEINEKINKVNHDISESGSSIISLTEENEKLISYLNPLKAETLNLSKNDFIKSLNLKINDATNNIDELNRRNIQLIDVIKKYNAEIYLEQVNINKFESVILQYSTTELYVLYAKIKERYSIANGSEHKFFLEKIEFLNFKLNETKSQFDLSNKNLSEINLFLNNYGNHQSLFIVENEINILSEELKIFLKNSNEITSIIGKYINIANVNFNEMKLNLSAKVKDFEDDIEILKNNALNLKTLDFQVSQTLPYILYLDTKESINNKELKLINLDSLISKIKLDLEIVNQRLLSKIDNFFYTKLINKIYKKIDPHPFFKNVKFECVFNEDEKPRLEVYLYEKDSHSPISPSLYFSSAQLNILSLSIFLARALHVEHKGKPVNAILIDDPIQSMDSINVLATIDLLRNISKKFDKQIILSTHDENFHELLKLKLSETELGAKFISFSSYGKVIQN